MALVVGDLEPAVIKAKNVATEEYVDTSLATFESIDTDLLAQQLGYIDYADMTAEAVAGNTVISGGLINTELLTGTTIVGTTVVGSTIQTNGAASVSGGIELTGEQLTVYDGSGNPRVLLGYIG